MLQYSVKEWLLIFYIYCFLGWCFESAYVSLRTRHWVNRGFMRSPFLPLYGSGAILMLIVSQIFSGNLFLIYFAGCIGATLLELATGAAMEMLYKIKYWDYSNQCFNYKGHICLTSSIAWGFFTILLTRLIHAPVLSVVSNASPLVQNVFVFGLTLILILDFAFSFNEAIKLRNVLIMIDKASKDMEQLRENFREVSDHSGEPLQYAVEQQICKLNFLSEQIAEMKEAIQAELTASYEVRISKFRNFTEEKDMEALSEIKKEYTAWRKLFVKTS